MTWRGSWVTWALVAIMALVPSIVEAQPSTSQPSTVQPASVPDQQILKSEQLDALVAPIALYPDTLLAQVLIASTYPLEVVQADRWVNENKKLQGDKLKEAVDKQPWDENVRSLVATPSVLAMMSTKLDWTQKLGDAVLAQQPDVMDAVQRLRSKAEANKKLVTTKEQKVTVTQQQNKRVIAIEPAVANTVYVPYYDPAVVYGAWPYPAYPPYYYYPPGYIAGGILATGLAFGAGYALGRWAGGGYWGGNINWSGGGNNIIINRPGGGGGNWQHRPEHRQGVRYNNTNVQQKFGNNNRGGAGGRQDFRGRGGDQVLKPGGDRPSAGTSDRPGKGGGGDKGNRPSQGAGKGGGDRGDRPSQGAGKGGGDRGNRPSQDAGKGGGGGRDNGMKVQSGKSARAQSERGHRSAGGGGIERGGGGRGGGGGGGISRGGGGRGGGGGGRGGGGRGGGGRRSDLMLKHDIVLLGRLHNSIGVYRFAYNGSEKAYVGVIAQEVQMINPEAVMRGRDGYLRVDYEKLGVKFQTYEHWIARGSTLPQVHPSAPMPKTSER